MKQENPKDQYGKAKVAMELVPATSIIYEALAMADGANKYGPYNWRENEVRAGIYIGAAMRHLSAWYNGEENAEDSGVSHLGHAKACLGIIIDAMECEKLVDDRPVQAPVSELLTKNTKTTNKVSSNVAKRQQKAKAFVPLCPCPKSDWEVF